MAFSISSFIFVRFMAHGQEGPAPPQWAEGALGPDPGRGPCPALLRVPYFTMNPLGSAPWILVDFLSRGRFGAVQSTLEWDWLADMLLAPWIQPKKADPQKKLS